MDYLLPTAMEIPTIEIDHLESRSPTRSASAASAKAARSSRPPTLTNAIEDALSQFGVRIAEQYLPPSRILELIGAIPAEV